MPIGPEGRWPYFLGALSLEDLAHLRAIDLLLHILSYQETRLYAPEQVNTSYEEVAATKYSMCSTARSLQQTSYKKGSETVVKALVGEKSWLALLGRVGLLRGASSSRRLNSIP